MLEGDPKAAELGKHPAVAARLKGQVKAAKDGIDGLRKKIQDAQNPREQAGKKLAKADRLRKENLALPERIRKKQEEQEDAQKKADEFEE